MKNLNQTNTLEMKNSTSEALVISDLNMQVYNELGDHTNTSVNVLAMIQEQFKQIHEINKRRTLLLKEVSQYIVK